MFSSKYGSVLTILLIIVIIAILSIGGYFAFTIISNNSTKNAAEAAVDQFDQDIPTVASINEVEDNETTTLNVDVNATNSSSTGSSTKVMLEGYEVIGTIRIPTIDLKYPILSEVTKKSLETAVALLYTQNGLNQGGNSVIIGHNYRNSLFFSKNDQLKNGDAIYIKDKSGTEIKYKITNIFETSSSDASFYKSDDTTTRTITLSTCTDDASTTDKRLIIVATESD